MVNPRVWAPNAGTVAIAVGGRVTRLRPEAGGWWVGDPLPTGTDYAFVLDDDPIARPDPRSRQQPHGVDGPSRAVDPTLFAWTDHSWSGRQLAGSVFYELHVGTFTRRGTLDAAIERLPHLVDLGIDIVELLPVNAFDGPRNWGYDGVHWFAVDESYGGPDAYRRFVDACHSCGLAVAQDVVYNHLGPVGNHLPHFGPYLHEDQSGSWGASPDFEQTEVRRLVIDNARMWFDEYHVDALRIDAVHAMHDPSPTHVLAELAAEVDALSVHLRRPLTLIAESDLNEPIVIGSLGAGGYGMDGQWNDDFHHALHVAVTGETSGLYADYRSIEALAKVLTRGFFFDGSFSSLRGRMHGSPLDTSTVPGYRLVVAIQNHDQVGNRAAGDRISSFAPFGSCAAAATLLLTSPFTPLLFMGEEWGASTPWHFFTSFSDPDLMRAVVDGRLAELARTGGDVTGVVDPGAASTFVRSTLDWSELDRGEHAQLIRLYQELIRLRRRHPELSDPRLDGVGVVVDIDHRSITVERGRFLVAANLGDRSVELPVVGERVFATDDMVGVDLAAVHLPPCTAVIVRR